MDSAEGCIVRDIDGNEFIDFNSSHGVMNIGHSNPKIIEAIKKQAENLIHYSNNISYSEISINLSKKLSDMVPMGSSKKVFFSNSEAEAVESGLKIAIWHTRNSRIIAFLGAYHGSTLGALSLAAEKPVLVRHFPALFAVDHVPYPYCYRCAFKQSYPDCHYWCIDYIEDLFSKKIPPEKVAAIVFEPIQERAGCIVPPPEYFKRLKSLADKYEILLMDDEAQTSIGRAGRWFAIEDWNVSPDILCLGGLLSSGLPLGVTITTEKVMDWEPDSHTNVLGGNPVVCAAALAVIDVAKSEHLLENSARQGKYAIQRLQELAEKYPIIGDVRGKGLMIGFEVIKDLKKMEPGIAEAREIVKKSFRRGVLSDVCGASVVQITPSLSITQELLDRGLDIIEGAISEVVAEKQ
ncbi:MAG: aminotransferase class III-fold pyridoxal phosphate-dependent enzyme [Candidatus Bathyarchaeota archaeon]